MRVSCLLAAFLYLLGAQSPASAQNVQDAMTPFLSGRDMRELERDSRGNLWIATHGGALRFELANRDWEVFPRLLGTGPRGNDLVTVCVDAEERVWFGSASRGFTFYNPDTHLWDRESEEWPDPRIRVIRCLGGGVYIGTAGGLSLKPTENRTDICAASDPGCIVPSYVVNDYALMNDTLWVATEGGLGRFNGVTWDSVSALPPTSVGQPSRSLAVYAGALWEVSASSRVRRLQGGSWTGAILTMAERVVVTDNRLYALGGNRVYRWEGAAWADLHVPLGAEERVRDIEVFGQDMYLALNTGLGLWQGGGTLAAQFVPPGPRFPGTYSSLAADTRGIVWAGTSEQSVGLVKFDGTIWTGIAPFEAEGLGPGWLLGMLADSENVIWLGHCCCFGNNLSACTLEQVEIGSAIGDVTGVTNVRSFDEDAQGRMWMGTHELGVVVRDDNGPLFDLTIANTGGAMSSDIVRAIAVSTNNTYIGHESAGLDIWPHGGNLNSGRDGSNWIHLGDQNGLLDEAVRAMTFRDGELWVATASGIHRLAGSSVQERCPARDRELPGDPIRTVNTLVTDRLGGLWLGTESGILYLPKGGACDGGGGDFLSFTVENSPLPSNRVTAATLNPRDGSVWFGTTDGLLRVDPLVLEGSNPPPDRFVLYPNPVYPASAESARRSAVFGIERGGVRVEVVSSDEATQPQVYDLAGQHVGDFEIASGTGRSYWVWRCTNLNGDVVAPGIYFVHSEVGGSPVTLKMGVVR